LGVQVRPESVLKLTEYAEISGNNKHLC